MSRADEIMAKLGKAKVIPQLKSLFSVLNPLPEPVVYYYFYLKVKKTATNWSWEDEELMYEMNQVYFLYLV